MATPAEQIGPYNGAEMRRSTRLLRSIRLMVVGEDRLGQPYRERMSTVSLNLHGCCFQSWHNSQVGAPVDLQLADGMDGKSPLVRARVRSVRPPMSHSELYQIGVEFDMPANIWGINPPPEDWLRMLEGTTTATELAQAAAASAWGSEAVAATPSPETETRATPEQINSRVTEFPSPPPTPETPATPQEPARHAVPSKIDRVTITMDQLIAALQGKLQRAAERAVQAAMQTQLDPMLLNETVKSSVQVAVATQLDEAVRQALCKIDEVSSANVRQAEASATQRLEEMLHSREAEILSLVDARFKELGIKWEDQQEAHRLRSEEMIGRLGKLLSDTQRELAEARRLAEELPQRAEPHASALERSSERAKEEFEAAAARVADRQLVRLVEEKQMVTREASAQLDACAAGARAALQSAASEILEEFRRQIEIQVDLAISEAGERVHSSLTALEAENRIACEARRKSLEDDVTQATEKAAEQFRSGIKAFLYASLVAAVGAVDEHAQTTLAGLVRERSDALKEIGGGADSVEGAGNRSEARDG